jgi:hypothetical protein
MISRTAFECWYLDKYKLEEMPVTWHEKEQRYTILTMVQESWEAWQAGRSSIEIK